MMHARLLGTNMLRIINSVAYFSQYGSVRERRACFFFGGGGRSTLESVWDNVPYAGQIIWILAYRCEMFVRDL